MTETLLVLINICSSVIDLKNKFFNSNRKKAISEWLEKIGINIQSIADSLKINEYPYQTCSRMTEAYNECYSILGNVVDDNNLEKLNNLLGESTQIEKIFGEYSSVKEEEKQGYINQLYTISGTILGISDTLKYSP